LKKERNGLYVGYVFPVIEKKPLKCGFIQKKKGYALVVEKRIVNGGGVKISWDNKWNIRDLFLNIELTVVLNGRYVLQSWVDNLL
jgi:hypothetical protein